VSFHGINTSRQKAKSVTHVSGTKRHLSLGSGTQYFPQFEMGYAACPCSVAIAAILLGTFLAQEDGDVLFTSQSTPVQASVIQP
ncbi:hypothetical protein, partial [Rhizobium sp. BK196]|uniref:hypothetical protein n=1 Tax=Rhizobium sp. BK196 TaxID=2587073 RepID=UPI001AEE5E36